MATSWINQPENQGAGGTFMFLIDDTHFFLIDDTYKLLIDDGSVNVTWTDQVKN